MFERFTEKARRVIFFARYEASQYGSSFIETEHLLLGLMRENGALILRSLRPNCTAADLKSGIDKQIPLGQRIPASQEVPLTEECKKVLMRAPSDAPYDARPCAGKRRMDHFFAAGHSDHYRRRTRPPLSLDQMLRERLNPQRLKVRARLQRLERIWVITRCPEASSPCGRAASYWDRSRCAQDGIAR